MTRKRRKQWDLFISHAWEDKEAVVDPLASELTRRGVQVWYDKFALKPGDSLRESIDLGLANSRFGVVVLSKAFFAKKKSWPERELSALYGKGNSAQGEKIIPIWHEISVREIRRYSPMLTNLIGIKSDMPIRSLVNAILEKLHLAGVIDAKDRLSTGIPTLDVALGGGLPRPSSIVIAGPKGIGKTTLAMQIQGDALRRGKSCLYITYREAPIDIIHRFDSMGFPIHNAINGGIFRILDNFSPLHDIPESTVRNTLPTIYRKAVVYIPNPENVADYFQRQFKVMQKIGFGGVNIVDSVNERLKLLGKDITATDYFKNFRAKLARMGGQSALHIVSTDSLAVRKVGSALRDFQDGSILLRFASKEDRSKRYLKIDSLRGTAHESEEMEFVITNEGVSFNV